MSTDDLRDVLDGFEPTGFDEADPADLARLADAIGDARHHHRVALESSTEQALRKVPRLLRGPISKLLG